MKKIVLLLKTLFFLFTKKQPGTFTRQFIANRDSKILVDGECIGLKSTAKVAIQWTLAVFDDCSAKDTNGSCKQLLQTKTTNNNESDTSVSSGENYQFLKSQIQTVTCGNAKDFYTRWTPFYLYVGPSRPFSFIIFNFNIYLMNFQTAVGFDPIDSETCVNSTLPNNSTNVFLI